MSHSTLTPVFTGLRIGLNALIIGLTAFAVARSFIVGSQLSEWTLAVGLAFMGVYYAGAWIARNRPPVTAGQGTHAPAPAPASEGASRVRHRHVLWWLIALTLLWGLFVLLTPDGAYLVFPLFFLYLHALPDAGGGVAVMVTTAAAILALGLHHGFSAGGVIGPIVGAGVALLIGLAYRALTEEARERERLLRELLKTREQLAETEREQGALAERARLARDIHDTVAQGLSSIQMLLRAAERDTPEPGASYLVLARETAADSLAETRQIFRELTPARLDNGLSAALRRLGEDQSRRFSVPIDVNVEDIDLPMGIQTAILRIAQGALSNAVRHADASRIVVELAGSDNSVSLIVRDDGCGFDASAAHADSHKGDSFGVNAMRERVEQLDGTLTITSSGDHGTTVTAWLPVRQNLGDQS